LVHINEEEYSFEKVFKTFFAEILVLISVIIHI